MTNSDDLIEEPNCLIETCHENYHKWQFGAEFSAFEDFTLLPAEDTKYWANPINHTDFRLSPDDVKDFGDPCSWVEV